MKITLKNLAKATAQQVFEQVAKHLLKQGVKSEKNIDGEPYCSYRAIKKGETLKCAAGCLIAKGEYNPDWEDTVWSALANNGRVPQQHSILIQALQTIHDNVEPKNWLFRLKDLAQNESFDYAFLEAV